MQKLIDEKELSLKASTEKASYIQQTFDEFKGNICTFVFLIYVDLSSGERKA